MYKLFIPLMLLMVVAACRPKVFPPKPPGYFKIDTPAEHAYRVFDEPGFPYTFEYPTYARIAPDSAFFEEKADNPYWINIFFPDLGGIINFTYKEINAKQPLDYLTRRAYDLSFFHHEKSQGVDNEYYNTPFGAYITTYQLDGDAASKFQFTATDSVKHFIRGALYFDVTPNADSLQPAYDFVQRDIEHMMMTLKWKR